jgi:hypothetical protein
MSSPQSNLFNPNITGKLATRDGGVGAEARLFLPFIDDGYWFRSGQIVTFPRSEIPQNENYTLVGTAKTDTFRKDCCTCL